MIPSSVYCMPVCKAFEYSITRMTWHMWNREKAEAKFHVGPGEGKKQTHFNMVTLCVQGLHNQISMANLMVHSASTEKTEKTRLSHMGQISQSMFQRH